MTINFDGKGPKDIVEQSHSTLEGIDLGEAEMGELKELARKIEKG